ncbi:MAG TPA: thiopeptide-type bacteriocin biosynthesis protein [Candidatus Polarisedimenticolaceae bacterium]|nr:thiopeptide-type bacteriocin biosynthesis protein [Candidatus Polarisedimenticolaceae bacterium]
MGDATGEVVFSGRDEACLYTLFHADTSHHEELLRTTVIPLVHRFRAAPEMHSLFFARYSEPDWQLRFRVLGDPAWIEREVRPRIDAALPAARSAGLYDTVEYATYQREWERYGGETGMPLAEKVFLHDSLACLDLIEAEAAGALFRSRREWSLLFTDRFLDLFGLTVADKVAFYHFGHSWALRENEWDEGDLKTLDAKYEGLAPGLRTLVGGEDTDDALWGGPRPSRIARSTLEALAPVAGAAREGLRDGSIAQEQIYLLWSYAHMHANRLGISSTAEAILRYLMWRHWS